MAAYEDKYWWSRDGIRLHYRDYAGSDDRPPILCIPGLSRNVRDFEDVANRLAGAWRVLCVDLRGRADSGYAKDPMTYVPLIYLQDLGALFEELALPPVIGIGTSLGGIMLMLLEATEHGRLAGALLNDIGPDIEPTGLERIREGFGGNSAHPTWVHAARALAEREAEIYPDFGLEDWLKTAKQRMRLNSRGRIVPDYDPRLSEPFRAPGGEAGVDLWPAFDALAACPTTVVRGALSDILSAETARMMVEKQPAIELVTVPHVGHAPNLDEPESIAAIDRLLARVLNRGAA